MVDRHSEMPPFEPLTEQQINVGALALTAYRLLEDPLVVSLIDDVVPAYKKAQGLEPTSNSLVTKLSLISGIERFRPLGISNDNFKFYMESDYVEPAKELIAKVQNTSLPDGFRLGQDGRSLIYGSGKDKVKIKIQGFSGIDDPDHPSCQMLDAAWTLDRLASIGPTAITILPEAFSEQQAQSALLTLAIPDFHGHDYRVVSLLTDESGRYTEEFDWPLAA
ncbi:MAG: hypothetical protein WDN66_04910 [Candidatus Saccharibacteria bacterium]